MFEPHEVTDPKIIWTLNRAIYCKIVVKIVGNQRQFDRVSQINDLYSEPVL